MLPSTFRAFNAPDHSHLSEHKPLKSARQSRDHTRDQPSIGTQLISARRRQQKHHLNAHTVEKSLMSPPVHKDMQVADTLCRTHNKSGTKLNTQRN